ncbi:MAG TPA: FecR domain-containing protein [Vitreimonas sp.]|uniref:FecR family protein n=1 Tax=Vitreimonas sp. TaxID=3069702 RepID=UPI002D32D2C9|nr:FecR domain-containing protein [Vitreimonas sp.]HYD86042.1 FecR domain-containing protein [Vitreimonas sp.]
MSERAGPTPEAQRPLAEAAAWRIRLADAGVESSPEFEGWLAADESHLDAWRQVEAPWTLLGEQANSPALVARRRAALARAEKASRRWQLRQPTWRRLAAAAILLLALGAGGLGGMFWYETQPQRFATELGERRSVVLTDGSRISLDSGTDLRVRYTDSARQLELRRGQARFDVAHDPMRPFSVRAGAQTVIAVGTAFNVDLLGEDLRVTLIEGRVRVVEHAPRSGVNARRSLSREYTLEAGQQLVAKNAAAPVVAPANVTRAVAWERGQIDFADESLASVAERVARYSDRRIVIADEDVGEMRLSGVVNTGDVADFVDLVTSYLPVEAVTRENGDIELRERAI